MFRTNLRQLGTTAVSVAVLMTMALIAPDTAFAELRRLYEDDDRVHVPGTVFNAVLNRNEALNAMSAGG